jgi:hypothetical protein
MVTGWQCFPVTAALFALALGAGADASLAATTSVPAGGYVANTSQSSGAKAAATVGLVDNMMKVLTAPLKLPVTIAQTSVQKNIAYGMTIGAVRGVGRSVADVVNGTMGAVSAALSGGSSGLAPATSLLGLAP